MAVEGPDACEVCIEAHRDLRARRDSDRILKCAGDLLAVNFQDLNVMAMQVHRVRHAGVIGNIDLHAFTDSDIEGVTIWVSTAPSIVQT
jgi:hypothetical protein